MSDVRTVENLTRTRISVEGVAIEPNQTAEVPETDAVRELATSGVLRLNKPKTTRRSERATDTDPKPGEE